jgi:hypothetical protein
MEPLNEDFMDSRIVTGLLKSKPFIKFLRVLVRAGCPPTHERASAPPPWARCEAAHKIEDVRERIEATGAMLRYLPLLQSGLQS